MPLIEGTDFYYNDQGLMVFTEAWHLKRGFCCGNGCLHCPYGYENVPEPRRGALCAAIQTAAIAPATTPPTPPTAPATKPTNPDFPRNP